MSTPSLSSARLDYLDATRAFALVLGVVFHASLSFMPVFMGWAVQDISTGWPVVTFVAISHSFRMELFFLIAGFFGCLTLQRKGLKAFVRARAGRILGPFVVGWFLLRPLVISGWTMGAASLRGDYGFWAEIVAGFKSLASLPAGIFTGTHLWFLYYLALVTAVLLTLRGVTAATGNLGERVMERADACVGWLARSPFAMLVFAPATAAALWFMQYWGMDTPDRSLVPHGPVLLVYAGFFSFGWLIGRQPEAIVSMSRLTIDRWLVAGAGIAGVLWLGGVQANPGHPHYTAAHVGFVVSYAMTMWSLVFLTIGIFRKLCGRPRAWIRYVADSSYWMYLAHLPIVVWLQVAIAEVTLHWSVKWAIVSLATVGLSLITYDLFVRSTWVGQWLNGRRRERAVARIVRLGGDASPYQATRQA